MRKARKIRVCLFCGNYHPNNQIRWFKVGKGNGYRVMACMDCRAKYYGDRVFKEQVISNLGGGNVRQMATAHLVGNRGDNLSRANST